MPLGRARHTCHAHGCDVEVPERMFMCRAHWAMVPKAMQRELWAVYVEGQEISKTPTSEYLAVAIKIRNYVKEQEAA